MKTGTTSAIRKFVIAGSGLEAWLTASFLLNQLGHANIQVLVCPVTGSDELDPLYTVIPQSEEDVLQMLGISNIDLVKDCKASFSLGTRNTGLCAPALDQFRPYGGCGVDFPGGAFIHHWLLDRKNSGQKPTASDYFSYSPAYQAARRNAFAPPVGRNAIGSLQHQMARHVDVQLLTTLLRKLAISKGATQAESALESVKRLASNQIAQLVTETGQTLQADLFIDCSGTRRVLVDETSWTAAALSSSYKVSFKNKTEQSPPPPFSLVSAHGSGWQFTNPGYGWLGTIDLIESPAASGGLFLTPGYLARPWSENRVALGVAAFETLPLEALQAKTLITGLKRLVRLLPGPDFAGAETIEFNNLFEQDSQEAAKLNSLYEIARQHSGIDPSTLSDLDIPEDLKNRLALFSKRGWVAPLDSHLISCSDWSAVYMLLGLFPAQHDRIVERMPADKLRQTLNNLKTRIEQVAAEFPPHGAYLDAIKSSPGSKT